MTSTVLRPESIIKALHGAFCRDASRQDLLQMAATRIQRAGPPYAGVYVYGVRDNSLTLEAHAGRAAEATSVPGLAIRIRLHDDVLGEIAVESDIPNAFDEAEEDAVRAVADALAVLL